MIFQYFRTSLSSPDTETDVVRLADTVSGVGSRTVEWEQGASHHLKWLQQAQVGGRRGRDNFEIECSTIPQAAVEVQRGLVAVCPVRGAFRVHGVLGT